MPAESLSFDITAHDNASRKFRDVGDAALAASAKMDIAAASAKLWNDTAISQGKAANTSIAAMKSHAAATALAADAERVLAGEATKTTKLMADQGQQAQKTATRLDTLKAAFTAAAGTGAAGGAGGAGMGALIGAGAALAPLVATLGVGLTGLGVAAYGIYKPISIAAQATGGLQKNLHTLAPEQQQVALSLLALGRDYGAFQKSLAPTVLSDFNTALTVARHLLVDIQPVTKATGAALGGLLTGLDQQFQSGAWQNFFKFLSGPGAGDVRLLDQSVLNLVHDLPGLVQALQPASKAILQVASAATGAIGPVTGFLNSFERRFPLSTEHTINFFKDLDHWTVQLTNHLGPWARAINNAGTGAQHALTGAGSAAGPAAKNIGSVGSTALTAAASIQAMATAVANLTTAQGAALATQTAYGAAILTSANDAVALEKALDVSHGKVGLLTATQRASFGAANTYINDLGAQATQAVASGHGVDAAMKAISHGLPVLDSAKTKNKQYWQEVQTLVGWLDKLRLEKAIRETVFVTGSGTFTVRPGTSLGLPGGSAGGPFGAKGAYITQGTTPTADNVLARVSKGELIVPTHMVAAGLVDHLRGSIPGFAAGGLIPSYSGTVAGLPPWGTHDLNATVAIFEQATAKATLAGMKAAQSAARSAANRQFPGGGGGGSGAAIARAMFPWPSSMWPAFNYVEMREAGYSLTARNPSSGAYGVAQFINGPGEYYQYGGNPNTFQGQFTGMFNYIRQRYGNPVAAAAHEQAFNWYDGGGWLYPGVTRAVNTTGTPERVTSPAQESAQLAALGRIEKLLATIPGATGDAVGGALHGAARSATYRGMYSPRGA